MRKKMISILLILCMVFTMLPGSAVKVRASEVTVPDAPMIGTAIAGDVQATVNFTPPTSNGGAPITGYTVTSNPGGFTGTGATSPITVVGLTNGVAYTFTVTATNSAGTGPSSAASNSITPRSSQKIHFDNPGAQNFGTSPTLFATSDSGLPVTFTSENTGVCTITSSGHLAFLTAGTATITAHQEGNELYLAAEPVSRSFTVNPVAPGAPTIGTATDGDSQATVNFTPPAVNGGTTITGYTVTSNPGGFTGTGATSPITVSGLTNGVAYTFTVTATNSAGTGPSSAASNSVTPRMIQTITFANPGDQTFGTSPTLFATSDSSLPVTFTSETPEVCTITSSGQLTFLTAGTAIITTHQEGNGSYLAATMVSQSFKVNPVTPGVPTIGTATAGNGQATVNFTPPASNGGATITGYTVTSNPGGITTNGDSSPIIVSGLTNGVAYTFTVTATNSAGSGSASEVSNSVTPIEPINPDSSPVLVSIPMKPEGKVEKDYQQYDGAPVVSVNNSSDELKASVLTPKELEMVAKGENAKVVMKVMDISDSVSNEEKELIRGQLASMNANVDLSVLYVDLSLYKQVGNQEQTKVTQTNSKISITIEVPERFINTDTSKNRSFYIIRIHDSVATRIEGIYDPVTHRFTFETDRFSTYALTYQDTSNIQTYHDFHHLQLTAKPDKNTQTLTYKKVANVDGYLIYGGKCGKKMTKLEEVSANTTSYTVRNLKKGTYYKYQVKAYRMIDGEQVIIMSSKVIHSITESKTYSDPIKVTSNTESVRLATGRSKTVGCKVVLPKGGKLKEHTALIRYESSNKAIATVNSMGKITAKAKGSCYVYAYAQNGVYQKIKVTVDIE